MHVRSFGGSLRRMVARQIDLFCMLQLKDVMCPVFAQNGGSRMPGGLQGPSRAVMGGRV
jgi:hypothetical protein